ncbi:hypothetical protein [Niallia taxi]|uniref:hypothetical protein n=1 Tax=Niallia taxi TaxID=2499688 RepID=UPI002E1F0C46|nr:hypothetical protein [Niallia taxi]
MLIILGLYLLFKQNKGHVIKKGILSFLNLMQHPFMILTLIYIVAIFYIFNEFGIIKGADLIKDYIKLIIFGLFPMIYKVITKYNNLNILDLIKGMFKFSIIPLFIINEYTFNIFVELFLTLLVSFLTILSIYSDSKPEYKSVKKLTNFLLGVIVIYIVAFAFKDFVEKIDDVKNVVFWEKMFFELLLIAHIPLLKCLQIACYYEHLMIRIKIKSSLAGSFRGKIRIYFLLFKYCKVRVSKLESATEKVKRNRIVSFQSLEDLLI